jgi:hypothetical protein
MKKYLILITLIISMPLVFAQDKKKAAVKRVPLSKVVEKTDPVEEKKEETNDVSESSSSNANTNIRVGAINALAGTLDLQADFAVSKSWSVGPTLIYLSRTIDDFEAKAFGAGARGNYYFNREVFTQGWYLGPAISYIGVTVKGKDSLGGQIEASGSGVAVTLFAGYQWIWDNFNMALGAGPVYYSLGKIKVKSDNGADQTFDSYDGARFALEYTIGWKF